MDSGVQDSICLAHLSPLRAELSVGTSELRTDFALSGLIELEAQWPSTQWPELSAAPSHLQPGK